MKYLTIVCVAAITLVSCGGDELDACGCLEEATKMIEGMESAEELDSFEEKLEEAHPECADIDESDVEANCKEETEAMMTAMMSKAMELYGDAMGDIDLDINLGEEADAGTDAGADAEGADAGTDAEGADAGVNAEGEEVTEGEEVEEAPVAEE
ncbi:MAG: hypothetical protein CMN34_05570 [Saprospirales bacterium]|nr:hypothetical protein [Saprospirales bacterium]